MFHNSCTSIARLLYEFYTTKYKVTTCITIQQTFCHTIVVRCWCIVVPVVGYLTTKLASLQSCFTTVANSHTIEFTSTVIQSLKRLLFISLSQVCCTTVLVIARSLQLLHNKSNPIFKLTQKCILITLDMHINDMQINYLATPSLPQHEY